MQYEEWLKAIEGIDSEVEITLNNGHVTRGQINREVNAVFWESRLVVGGGEYFHYDKIKSLRKLSDVPQSTDPAQRVVIKVKDIMDKPFTFTHATMQERVNSNGRYYIVKHGANFITFVSANTKLGRLLTKRYNPDVTFEMTIIPATYNGYPSVKLQKFKILD